jgi:hypothetical protein
MATWHMPEARRARLALKRLSDSSCVNINMHEQLAHAIEHQQRRFMSYDAARHEPRD